MIRLSSAKLKSANHTFDRKILSRPFSRTHHYSNAVSLHTLQQTLRQMKHENIILNIHGDGNNGKSVFINLIREVMPNICVVCEPEYNDDVRVALFY